MDDIIVVFGSARVPERQTLSYIEYYDIGRTFALNGYGISQGSGSGIMEAISKGVFKNGGYVNGEHITLPYEHQPHEYHTHYNRHTHFSERQRDLMDSGRYYFVAPGGVGTIYELFYLLTEITTGKRQPRPIVLFDSTFWTGLISYDKLIKQGVVDKTLTDLFIITDSISETIDHFNKWRNRDV